MTLMLLFLFLTFDENVECFCAELKVKRGVDSNKLKILIFYSFIVLILVGFGLSVFHFCLIEP